MDGLVQDCSNCIKLAVKLLQSDTKPSILLLLLPIPSIDDDLFLALNPLVTHV